MTTKTVTVSGGFHNVGEMTMRISDKMSTGQYKRLDRHLCGVEGCICGGRGFELSGMDRKQFDALREDAQYEIWKAKNR